MMYIVKYSEGSYEDFQVNDLFVTNSKSKASKYCKKFNSIHKRWKKHYSQYEESRSFIGSWIKEEYVEKHFRRWNMLRDINKCYYEPIEQR